MDAYCRICHLSETVAGTTSDKTLAQSIGYDLPEDSFVLQDLGFQGFETAGSETVMPRKKPRGRKLSRLAQIFNRIVSRSRVDIEHAIASLKRCRTAHESLRLLREGAVDQVMEIACGLHNLRLRLCPWRPVPIPGEFL